VPENACENVIGLVRYESCLWVSHRLLRSFLLSGLYRAVADTFATAFPSLSKSEFLDAFRSLGCYLVDLSGQPVDHKARRARQCICRAGEIRLARTIRELHPKALVTIVRSIRPNVRRAKDRAGWSGLYLELPYPGRWHYYRVEFARQLVPLVRKTVRWRSRSNIHAFRSCEYCGLRILYHVLIAFRGIGEIFVLGNDAFEISSQMRL
jgi:hypothetical protein